jgi:hypothetical protein
MVRKPAFRRQALKRQAGRKKGFRGQAFRGQAFIQTTGDFRIDNMRQKIKFDNHL